MADWASNANAACEQDFHDVFQPVVAVLPMLTQTLAAMRSGAEDTAKTTQIAGQILDLSGAYRKVAGDLRAIRVPGGGRAAPRSPA